jgi:hypothetical protein
MNMTERHLTTVIAAVVIAGAWGSTVQQTRGASLATQTAQPPIERLASPAGSSAIELGGRYDRQGSYVGGRWMEIKYGRPIKRGRDLFGPPDFADALADGAPVWRAGANTSTRLLTEIPVVIGGRAIAPGEYTVFIDLQRHEWTLIISAWPAQLNGYNTDDKTALFGAYDYTPDKDVVRTPMTLEVLPRSFEQLSWEFLDVTDAGGKLALLWDRQLAFVPFTLAK